MTEAERFIWSKPHDSRATPVTLSLRKRKSPLRRPSQRPGLIFEVGRDTKPGLALASALIATLVLGASCANTTSLREEQISPVTTKSTVVAAPPLNSADTFQAIVGTWMLVAGGLNERIVLSLKEDQTYTLLHWVELHDIRGEDSGTWMLHEGIVSLSPKIQGTVPGEMFVPYHCAKLQIATYGNELALVSVSVPVIPYTMRQHAIFLREKPDKARETTAPSGGGRSS